MVRKKIETWEDVYDQVGGLIGVHPRVLGRMFEVARAEPDAQKAHRKLSKAMYRAALLKLPKRGATRAKVKR
jgi:hypothetical protein